MQTAFKLFFSCFFCFSLFLLSGCGGHGSSALVGKWKIEEGQSPYVPRGYSLIENMELLKDGTGLVDGMAVTWKTEKGRLFLIANLGAGANDYKISGTTLTLMTDDGQKIIYKKRK